MRKNPTLFQAARKENKKRKRNIPATMFMCLDLRFLLGLSLLLANLFPLLVRRLLVLAVVAHRWPLSTCSFQVSILPPPTMAVLPSVRLAPMTAPVSFYPTSSESLLISPSSA